MIPCPDHPYEDINRCSRCRAQRGHGKPRNFQQIFEQAKQQAREQREAETREDMQP